MESNEFTLMQKLFDCTSSNQLDEIFGNLAYYLLLNFNSIGAMSTSAVASACFTSPSTVRRFCNKLGYANFSDLKDAKAGNPEDQKQIAQFNEQRGRFSPKYMQEHINKMVYSIARTLDYEMLNQVADSILRQQNLVLFAIRPYALWLKEFQAQMLFIGKPTYLADDLENYRSLFERVSHSFSCIVVSPTGGIAGTLAHQIGALACEKTLVICREYNRESILGASQACYERILQLKLETSDINFMELFGKYGIAYLFDLLLGKIVERQFPTAPRR